MAFIKREKSGKHNAGTRMIVPGLGILTVNMENGDKIRIKPNQLVGDVLPPPTGSTSN